VTSFQKHLDIYALSYDEWALFVTIAVIGADNDNGRPWVRR
jgi:hypothetical protein